MKIFREMLKELLRSKCLLLTVRRLYEDPREDQKELYVGTYEDILYELRRKEKDLLNVEREKEYEKNRPPAERWYMLKSKEFSKELYRNRMDLKPNNQNKNYLEVL